MSTMGELAELVSFLSAERADVRAHATNIVASLSGQEALVPALLQLGVVPQLTVLATRDAGLEAPSEAVLSASALVNMAQVEKVREALVSDKVGFVDKAMGALRSGKHPARHLLLMILANVSREEAGARALLQEGSPLQGLHIIRLAQWFVEKLEPFPSKVPGFDESDTYQFVGHILTNISQLHVGRQILVDRERKILKRLVPHLNSKNPTRKLGVLRALRNVCLEAVHLPYVLSDEVGLLPYLIVPLCGPDPIEEHHLDEMPSVIRQNLHPKKKREPDHTVRMLLLEIILLGAREDATRPVLKKAKVYPILRDLHTWEQENGNDQADKFLQDLIPYFILDEPDAAAANYAAAAAAKKASVEEIVDEEDDDEVKVDSDEEEEDAGDDAAPKEDAPPMSFADANAMQIISQNKNPTKLGTISDEPELPKPVPMAHHPVQDIPENLEDDGEEFGEEAALEAARAGTLTGEDVDDMD